MVVVAAGNGVGREGKRVEQQVSGWVGKMGWVGGFYHMHSIGLSTPWDGSSPLLRHHKLSFASFNFNKTHLTLDKIVSLWPLSVGVSSTL